MMRRVGLIVLVVCMAAAVVPAAASSLFVWQTGDWANYEVKDQLGNAWIAKLEILEQNNINGVDYLHIRILNSDPYGSQPDDLLVDHYGRFTSTSLFIPYPVTALTPDGEYLVFQAAPVGTKWEVPSPGGSIFVNEYKEIAAQETVTVPYGIFTAYKQWHYYIWKDDPTQTRYTLSCDWLVPDDPAFGWIMVEDYSTSRENSEPHIWKLASVHHVPLPATYLLVGAGLLILGACRKSLGKK